jgi:hypothetical protein
MSEIPQDVRELAAGIADDIETHGHWQDTPDRSDMWRPRKNPGGRCCLIQSPTFQTHLGSPAAGTFFTVLEESVGRDALSWNDETPTAEVLATLRKIAVGERP